MSVDSRYRTVGDFPQTYKEAMASPNSRQWKEAMKEEMQSLKEHETFMLTQLQKQWGVNGFCK